MKSDTLDIMIDFETMSTRNNAAVASFAAVVFDPNIPVTIDFLRGTGFHSILNLDSQSKRHFEGETIYWWLKQSEEARRGICGGNTEIPDMLDDFSSWYAYVNGGRAWAYGAVFDHVILQDLYNQENKTNPIHFRNQMCMRTVVKLAEVARPETTDLIQHNALDDCISQAIWIQKCLTRLKDGNKIEA